MTKKILLSVAVIFTLTIMGCSTISETVSSAAKGTVNMAKSATGAVSDVAGGTVDMAKGATDAVTSKVSDVAGGAKDMVTSTKEATETVSTPETPSMTDMAKDKAIEMADKKTNGAASQVVDVLK